MSKNAGLGGEWSFYLTCWDINFDNAKMGLRELGFKNKLSYFSLWNELFLVVLILEALWLRECLDYICIYDWSYF